MDALLPFFHEEVDVRAEPVLEYCKSKAQDEYNEHMNLYVDAVISLTAGPSCGPGTIGRRGAPRFPLLRRPSDR